MNVKRLDPQPVVFKHERNSDIDLLERVDPHREIKKNERTRPTIDYRQKFHELSRKYELLKRKFEKSKKIQKRNEKNLRVENNQLKKVVLQLRTSIERERKRTRILKKKKKKKSNEVIFPQPNFPTDNSTNFRSNIRPNSLPQLVYSSNEFSNNRRENLEESDFQLAKMLQEEEENKIVNQAINHQFLRYLGQEPPKKRNNRNKSFSRRNKNRNRFHRNPRMEERFSEMLNPMNQRFQNSGSVSVDATYEELLELDKNIVKVGLSDDLINKCPIKEILGDKGKKDQCMVCLDNYEDVSKFRILPCFHRFHVDCIDSWLKNNKKCPICMMDIKEMFEKQLRT